MSFNLISFHCGWTSVKQFQCCVNSGNYLFYSFPEMILLWKLFLFNFMGYSSFLSLYSNRARTNSSSTKGSRDSHTHFHGSYPLLDRRRRSIYDEWRRKEMQYCTMFLPSTSHFPQTQGTKG